MNYTKIIESVRVNLKYDPKNKIHRGIRIIINSLLLLSVILVISIVLLAYAILLGPLIFHTVFKTDITDKEAIYYTLISLVPVALALLPIAQNF